ncbi:hypothetical protein ACQPXS_47275 (plasmid) [Streptomyces sp. CA-142005]|uniref:hypothetical protein n=1 Tax=Streptomyces sp. CA-142005 TaxID=3240052 RepID=UPI003D90A50E
MSAGLGFCGKGDMGDWDIIRAELDAAERERRVISDLVARIIASQFYDSQSAALYALSSTGTVEDGWDLEIRTATAHATGPDEQRALEALTTYCTHRTDKGPQPHWSALRW